MPQSTRVPLEYVDAVRDWSKTNGVSLRVLSRECGCLPNYLSEAFSRLEHGTRRGMAPEVVQRLEAVTGVSVDGGAQ